MEKNPSSNNISQDNNPTGVCERIYKKFVVGSIRRVSTLPQESMSVLPVHKIPHHENRRMAAEVVQVEFLPALPARTEKEKRKEEMAEMVKRALAKPNLVRVPETTNKPKSHLDVQPRMEVNYKDNSVVHVSIEKQPKIKAQTSDHETRHDDRLFSDYITRTKLKMRATSSDVGDHGKGVWRKDSLNEKVSAYVDRAKLRIRKGSTIGGDGGSKIVSFK